MELHSERREDDCVNLSPDEASDSEEPTETEHGIAHESDCRGSTIVLEPKHKVFLSHSGVQKDFVEQLCLDLERYDRYPFFDKRRSSIPIGEEFPQLIFDAIQQCQVGVLVLSEEFFVNTKWPMLELVAMVKEYKKPHLKIKIIPVFYHISKKQWMDLGNRARWLSRWEEWASKDKRINLEEWKMALEVLRPIKDLGMVVGMGEVKIRKEIKRAIFKYVQPETRLDDSYIQGRSRLCKVIREKINHHMLHYNGVRVIGLYGIGGNGKTTICKAMCNEMSQEFHGRVCHIELKNFSEIQLLREVLKKFTKIKPKMFDGLNIDQCREYLKRCIVNEAIFLAIDNVSDNLEVLKQAKTYLGVRWSVGSVVLVTARSLGELMRLKQYIGESDCMEMPELTKGDAMSLFHYHVTAKFNRGDTVKMDKQLVKRCVERCNFSKGAGKGHHYLPLALEVLGEELGCLGYDAELWDAQLQKIDMFEKELSGNKHPIFSILRTSYDSLSYEAQMLFMDVALFLPCVQYQTWCSWTLIGFLKCNLFEWLCMVHGLSFKEMMSQLESLRQISLLEDLGDGWTKIGMHDLWREFCVAETKVRKFNRQWVFLEQETGELSYNWENLKRMCFLNEGWRALHGVNFEDCVNVSVLKVNIGWFVQPSTLNLDLKGMKHLKSLELKANKFLTKCEGFGSLRNLVVLKWWSGKGRSPCIEEIGGLTKLQVLEIKGFDGEKLPNLSQLTLLQVVCFAHCDKVVTITGLNSKLTNLRSLCISKCLQLQECPGLDELYHLEDLDLWGCKKLKELPCLGLLTKLSLMNISECEMVRAVLGLSDLVTLKELRANGCYGLGHLPDMSRLTNLEVLRCTDLSKMASLDLGEFHRLKGWTSGWCGALKSVMCSRNLAGLTAIDLTLCMSLEFMPDLSHFPQLEELVLGGCARLMSLTSIVPLFALRILDLEGCRKLSVLPDHLSSSADLRVLRLQRSGIVLSEEKIRNLEASCKSLAVFPSSASSKYCNEYDSDSSKDDDDMETNVQNQCRSRRLWDPLRREKIRSLVYSNTGSSVQTEGEMNLLALTSSGMHKRWDWKNEASIDFAPQLWRPAGGVVMMNDFDHTTPEEVRPCSMALCKDNDHLLSASGGSVSFFTMMTDKFDREVVLQALVPSTATFIAFYPQDNDILAIGMDDSTIQILNVREQQVVCTLKAHQKRIISMAFSKSMRMLVSLGADAQLCLWRTDLWARRQLNFVQEQPDEISPCMGAIRVQFHIDQFHLLVVCKLRLAVYDALKLDCLRQWELSSPFTASISDATYSCDSQFVYASFTDGSVGVFDADSLWPRSGSKCRLAPPLHTPRRVNESPAYPTTIAANPEKRNQFSLGFSDGDVLVVELLEAEARGRAPKKRCSNCTCSSARLKACAGPTEESEDPTTSLDSDEDTDSEQIYESAEDELEEMATQSSQSRDSHFRFFLTIVILIMAWIWMLM